MTIKSAEHYMLPVTTLGPEVSAQQACTRTEDFCDAALLEAVAGGDEAAFGQLHRRYRHRVVAAARAILLDSHLAEDVAQEVVWEIWRKAARFDRSRGSAAGWILALARSRAIDRVRSVQSMNRHDALWGSIGGGPGHRLGG